MNKPEQHISPLRVNVIIPAYNEAESIAKVIETIPKNIEEIIVVSNRSTDQTEKVAQQAGATVLSEPRMGYGYACLTGINYLKNKRLKPDIVVFLDGDFSDYPDEMPKLISPIIQEQYDFVIGARKKELRENGSMTFPQIFGNWLATFLMQKMYRATFTDLGPFRAITYQKLLVLEMQDKTYGWTVEMQLKAIKHQLKYTEVPVKYRNRIGVSKVSGTLKGAFMAGVKILGWIFKYRVK